MLGTHRNQLGHHLSFLENIYENQHFCDGAGCSPLNIGRCSMLRDFRLSMQLPFLLYVGWKSRKPIVDLRSIISQTGSPSVCNEFTLYFTYMWIHATVSSPDHIMKDEQILNLRNSCTELNQHSPTITVSLTPCPCRCSNAQNASEPTLASPVFLRKHIQKPTCLRREPMWNPLGNHSPMSG